MANIVGLLTFVFRKYNKKIEKQKNEIKTKKKNNQQTINFFVVVVFVFYKKIKKEKK